jgi:hypothetical protein
MEINMEKRDNNSKHEKRKLILETINLNKATQQLQKQLSQYPLKNITSISLKNLTGNLNLQILKENGFYNIKYIYLEDGNITNIENIPESIHHFVCKNNLLNKLPILPRNLKFLNVEKNLITDIDLSNIPNLTNLNVSNNELIEINDIPTTITELNVSFNKLVRLDLKGVDKLKILKCNDNNLITIQNIPFLSLNEISYFHNPLKEIQQLMNNKKIIVRSINEVIQQQPPPPPPPLNKKDEDEEFKERNDEEEEDIEPIENIEYKYAIKKYFKLKTQYETSVKKQTHDLRKKYKNDKRKLNVHLTSLKGKCVVCARNVGNIFIKKNNHYIALCGDIQKSPCRLNIKIYNGIYYNFFEDMHFFKENTELSKQKIIAQKMDVLFNYVNDTDAMKYFKETFTEYNENNKSFMFLFDKYKLIYNNPIKQELIHVTNEKIYSIIAQINEIMEEYKKNPTNKDLLKTAIEMQTTELMPETEKLRKIKYEFVEVINTFHTGDFSDEVEKSVLIENEFAPTKFIYMVEPPKVIKFTV